MFNKTTEDIPKLSYEHTGNTHDDDENLSASEHTWKHTCVIKISLKLSLSYTTN